MAGNERGELIGGEVVWARDDHGDSARFGANGKARVELRDALSSKGSAP